MVIVWLLFHEDKLLMKCYEILDPDVIAIIHFFYWIVYLHQLCEQPQPGGKKSTFSNFDNVRKEKKVLS